jgi:putative Mn2+ efflux pump MntP
LGRAAATLEVASKGAEVAIGVVAEVVSTAGRVVGRSVEATVDGTVAMVDSIAGTIVVSSACSPEKIAPRPDMMELRADGTSAVVDSLAAELVGTALDALDALVLAAFVGMAAAVVDSLSATLAKDSAGRSLTARKLVVS